jgi:hypothetical protein
MVQKPIILLALMYLCGCTSSPGRWTDDVSAAAYCEMPLKEIERIAGESARLYERDYMGFTHIIDKGRTFLWLELNDNGLISLQIRWAERMMEIASFQRTQYCSDIPLREGSRLMPHGGKTK